MARYFGGFRDRLKKRTRNFAFNDKDIEWVKVATTFSWSPARREYQWQEPEDYLSSFLNGEAEAVEIEDIVEQITLEDLPEDDKPRDDSPDARPDHDASSDLDVPDADEFVQFLEPDEFQPPSQDEQEEPTMSPEAAVPADLPFVEEYKLQIVAALQRRGIRMETEKIVLPDELQNHLNNFHEKGRSSIDSYELRARLQNFREQVIDSYEQFNAASGTFHAFSSAVDERSDSIKDLKDRPEEGEDYESFIVSSLNRLEASMRDTDTEEMDREFRRLEGPDEKQIEITDDTDRREDGPTDPPSTFADDSWLVLPVDNRSNQDQEDNSDDEPTDNNPRWNIFDSEERRSVLKESRETGDPSGVAKEEDDDEVNENLLRALDNINTQIAGMNEPRNEEAGEKSSSAESSTPDLADPESASPTTARDDVESDPREKDTDSLSELLLQIRLDGDNKQNRTDTVEDKAKTERYPEVPPVSGEDEESKPAEPYNSALADEPEQKETSTGSRSTDSKADSKTDTREESTPGRPRETIEELRARSIEEERKKLYSLIGKLEKSTNFALDDPGGPGIGSRDADKKEESPAEKELPISGDGASLEQVDEPQTRPGVRDPEAREPEVKEPEVKEDGVVARSDRRPAAPQKATSSRVEKPDESVKDRPTKSGPARTAEPPASQKSERPKGETQEEQKVDRSSVRSPSRTTETREKQDASHVLKDEELNQERALDTISSILQNDRSSREGTGGDEHKRQPPHRISGASPVPEEEEPGNAKPVGEEVGSDEEVPAVQEQDLARENEYVMTQPREQEDVPVMPSPDPVQPEADEEFVEREEESPEREEEGVSEFDEAPQDEVTLKGVVECLAFSVEEPIPLKKIARLYSEVHGVKMPTESEVQAVVELLNEEYKAQGRSFRIKAWGGGIRMATHPQYAKFIHAIYKDNKPKKLSRTLMETLSIVAYSQPTTKPEIDFVRGVDSDYALRKLLELGLIDIVGRSDAIGKPLLYGTSERFLDQFGLSGLDALPKLREVEDLLGDPAFKKERLHLLALEGIEDHSRASSEESED